MATKTKAGAAAATIIGVVGLVWGLFVFYDRKAEAGVPARVHIIEENVKANTSRINVLEVGQADANAKLVMIMHQMEKQDLKLDKISDAVGAKK